MMTLVAPESLINVLGVVYVHKKTSDGGELYLTRFGLKYADLLEVENWYERPWFQQHRERLEGTSAVYRVPTKTVAGRSLDLVVKNCRVGEDIPVATQTIADVINAEFNSPWEEFALVMEMREGRYGPPELRIRTQEPLAIYVPPGKMQMWQSGRSQAKINRIRAKHPGIDIDILRQYKLVYGWIHGKNVVGLLRETGMPEDEVLSWLHTITQKSIDDMEHKGFMVIDMKPEHVIIEQKQIDVVGGTEHDPASPNTRGNYLKALTDKGEYSIIDYELLVRTPDHQEEVLDSRRHSYLDDQRDRFQATSLPPHLVQTEILAVPYVFGHVESTGGTLWVVGRNSRLFDYFLPERWRRAHSWRLSENNEVYYTFTKDHVHIVWKTSRVGEAASIKLRDEYSQRVEEQGVNSPFEEFAIAQYLSRNGVPTVYVRAIYMTGSAKVEPSVDRRRFESHKEILDPQGSPILRDDRNYITLRGYYNGPDDWVAAQQGKLHRPMDLPKAWSSGFLKESEYRRAIDRVLQKLRNVGYDGSLLKGNDMLLAIDPTGRVRLDEEKKVEVRICNFELLRKV